MKKFRKMKNQFLLTSISAGITEQSRNFRDFTGFFGIFRDFSGF